jgi:TetR/AcrR family transcriptional regulator, regulator of cefoperazone and chloramphenicol sensitivity
MVVLGLIPVCSPVEQADCRSGAALTSSQIVQWIVTTEAPKGWRGCLSEKSKFFVIILSRLLSHGVLALYCSVPMRVTMSVVRKRKRNRTARERALLLAASRLFASRGYEATTTREIAALAGCAEGLIHRYFQNKAGLLVAIIRQQVSQEAVDLHARLPLAPAAADEIVRLVDWEVERMWKDREFLRVVIPRAFLDPVLGLAFTRIGPLQRSKAISERLKKFQECRDLPDQEIVALSQFISVLGFMFGFLRPLVLRQNRNVAKKMAGTIAQLMARMFESADVTGNGRDRGQKSAPLFA